ncbi:MAG: hypothetical protein CMA64_06655 [Euryarchaeota archaeon]|nr:hypothetical protein [Euryarchaeota archaeon]|tara:strand:+ start:367 stop:1068 length:702 start_codon:yes stop_codon:yes gene_type:complete
MKYFISAPFGNYLSFSNAISVTGSWTLHPRPGLAWQILKTLRYVKGEGGWCWRNKIGLRNAGVKEGLKRSRYFDVMSLAAIDRYDWINLDSIVPEKQNVEINISCPNLDKDVGASELPGFELWPKYGRYWCICKIPPTSSNKLVDRIVELGYNQIHASNTLPTEKGGLSGRVLVPHTLRLIEYIKKTHPHVEVIAGGGVTEKWHTQYYLDAGADHISLGTVCFTPWKVKAILK